MRKIGADSCVFQATVVIKSLSSGAAKWAKNIVKWTNRVDDWNHEAQMMAIEISTKDWITAEHYILFEPNSQVCFNKNASFQEWIAENALFQ